MSLSASTLQSVAEQTLPKQNAIAQTKCKHTRTHMVREKSFQVCSQDYPIPAWTKQRRGACKRWALSQARRQLHSESHSLSLSLSLSLFVFSFSQCWQVSARLFHLLCSNEVSSHSMSSLLTRASGQSTKGDAPHGLCQRLWSCGPGYIHESGGSAGCTGARCKRWGASTTPCKCCCALVQLPPWSHMAGLVTTRLEPKTGSQVVAELDGTIRPQQACLFAQRTALQNENLGLGGKSTQRGALKQPRTAQAMWTNDKQ